MFAGLPGISLSKTVLILTDECVLVNDYSKGQAHLIEALPWEAEGFVLRLSRLLEEEGNGRQVLILNDMVEQHYRKERVPRLSILDKANIVKRRLNMVFSEYQYRAFLPANTGSEKPKGFSITLTKPKGATPQDVYLFAAFPESENVKKVMQAIEQSFVSIAGVGLLPVESAAMVNQLAARLIEKNEKPEGSIWNVFLGQQSSGGLRQIVTKNGEFALTRITPIIDTDLNPDSWVRDVAKEYQSTLGYLARFGLTPKDDVNLIVISSEKTHHLLHQQIENYSNLAAITVEEAAAKLGIKSARQIEQRYSDLLHVGWNARKFMPTMGMSGRALDALAKPRQAAMYLSLGLVFAMAGVTFYAANNIQTWYQSGKNMSLAQEQRQQIELIYEQEKLRQNDYGINFETVKRAVTSQNLIKEKNPNPYLVLEAVGQNITPDLKLSDFVVRTASNLEVGTAPVEGVPNATGAPELYTLTFTFAGTTKAEDSNRAVEQFRDKLAVSLPDYAVVIPSKIADLSYTQRIESEAGLDKKQAAPESLSEFKVQVIITPKVPDAG